MAISSSAALMAPRVSSLKNGIISGGITGISAGTSASALIHKCFDGLVFQRMVRLHHQTSSHRKMVGDLR